MSESTLAQRMLGTRFGVLALTGVVWAVSAALLPLLWDVPASDALGVRLPWVVFAIATFVVERYVVHLHFRGDNHTLTLGEVPLVVGLLAAAPLELAFGRLIGGLFLFVLIERQAPLKVGFNAGLYFLEGLVTGAVWYLLGGPEAELLSGGAIIVLVAVMASQLMGTVMVWTVIGITQQRFDVKGLRDALAVFVPMGMATVSAVLGLVVMWLEAPNLIWLPVVPFVAMLLAYRAFGSERRHRDALGFLYDVSRDVHTHEDASESLTHLMRELQAHLSSATLSLSVIDQRSGKSTTLLTGPGGKLDVRHLTVDQLEGTLGFSAEDVEPSLVEGRRMTAVARPNQQVVIVIRAESDLAGADAFDEVGFDLLTSVTNLAATIAARAELDEMKVAFLSAVSHELRTPLAVVMGTAMTLRHRGDRLRPDQTVDLVERLELNAHRLDRLLSDLLDIDRLTRGLVEPRRQVTDITELAKKLLHGMNEPNHPISLFSGEVRADVDAAQVERIIENLVRNAIKYSPDGTPIEVSLQREPSGIQIVVEDRGPGVPDVAKASILEPFVRLDSHHPSPGTGIGLSLVRRFAQLHDGDVLVTDRPGGGARFIVSLCDDRPDLLATQPAPSNVVPLRQPA